MNNSEKNDRLTHPAETSALTPACAVASKIVSVKLVKAGRHVLTVNQPTCHGFSIVHYDRSKAIKQLNIIQRKTGTTDPIYTGGSPAARNAARSSGGV
jgi:hypothetical protein